MSNVVGEFLRRLVITRADRLCEYCLIHDDDTFFGCEVDHIISVKHGGVNEESNLAYACVFCNRHKGTDIGSILADRNKFTRFFNPRQDKWFDHFRLKGPLIKPITDIGKVTATILRFNTSERILEREILIAIDRYPTEQAMARMRRLPR
jgi:hypothetical protein